MTLLITVGNVLVSSSYLRLKMGPYFDLVVTKKGVIPSRTATGATPKGVLVKLGSQDWVR